MGKMKEIFNRYKGTTVDADVYFPNESEPRQVRVIIPEKDPPIVQIKNTILEAESLNNTRPIEAVMHIYDTYNVDGDMDYMQHCGTIMMSTEDCWEYWKNKRQHEE